MREPENFSPFAFSSKIYSQIYSSKDTIAELEFIRNSFDRKPLSPGSKVLDIGCGTGRHSIELAKQGCDVVGIDRSTEMIAQARINSIKFPNLSAAFTDFELSELQSQQFDDIIALFHVVSYVTNDTELSFFFENARRLLKADGFFAFDVWYSPAVCYQMPSSNSKQFDIDGFGSVTRHCFPTEYLDQSLVDVNYTYEYKYKSETLVHKETHTMRHFTTNELRTIAHQSGFKILSIKEFLTGKQPSRDSWGVYYLLQAV